MKPILYLPDLFFHLPSLFIFFRTFYVIAWCTTSCETYCRMWRTRVWNPILHSAFWPSAVGAFFLFLFFFLCADQVPFGSRDTFGPYVTHRISVHLILGEKGEQREKQKTQDPRHEFACKWNFAAAAAAAVATSAGVAAISLREETKAFLHMQMGVVVGGGAGGMVWYGTQWMKINRLNSTNTYGNIDTYSGVHMVHSHVKKK